MKKIIIIILSLAVAGGGFLIWSTLKKSSPNNTVKTNNINSPVQKINMENTKKSSKKVLIIIASKDFKDEEYFGARQSLDDAGFDVTVASDNNGVALGVSGGEVNVNLIITDADVNKYDAIVFIGGPGALEHLDNQISYKIAKEAVQSNKLLASICISPVILAKAGVLKGKNATVWTSSLDKSPAKILEEHGAKFIDESVVKDGNIITGNGPSAAIKFGEKIMETLNSQ